MDTVDGLGDETPTNWCLTGFQEKVAPKRKSCFKAPRMKNWKRILMDPYLRGHLCPSPIFGGRSLFSKACQAENDPEKTGTQSDPDTFLDHG